MPCQRCGVAAESGAGVVSAGGAPSAGAVSSSGVATGSGDEALVRLRFVLADFSVYRAVLEPSRLRPVALPVAGAGVADEVTAVFISVSAVRAPRNGIRRNTRSAAT